MVHERGTQYADVYRIVSGQRTVRGSRVIAIPFLSQRRWIANLRKESEEKNSFLLLVSGSLQESAVDLLHSRVKIDLSYSDWIRFFWAGLIALLFWPIPGAR